MKDPNLPSCLGDDTSIPSVIFTIADILLVSIVMLLLLRVNYGRGGYKHQLSNVNLDQAQLKSSSKKSILANRRVDVGFSFMFPQIIYKEHVTLCSYTHKP